MRDEIDIPIRQTPCSYNSHQGLFLYQGQGQSPTSWRKASTWAPQCKKKSSTPYSQLLLLPWTELLRNAFSNPDVLKACGFSWAVGTICRAPPHRLPSSQRGGRRATSSHPCLSLAWQQQPCRRNLPEVWTPLQPAVESRKNPLLPRAKRKKAGVIRTKQKQQQMSV